MVNANDKIQELTNQINELKAQLSESQETLMAIQSGEVDALIVKGSSGEQVYTLKGAEHPYRVMVETMNEGAATLAADGAVFYCNRQLADLLKIELNKLISMPFTNFVAAAQLPIFQSVLRQSSSGTSRAEVELKSLEGAVIPVLVSARALNEEGRQMFSLIVTDLSEHKHTEEIVASERFAQTMLEQSADAIVVCDTEGKIIRASEKAQNMVGIDLEGLKFDQVFNCFYPVSAGGKALAPRITGRPLSLAGLNGDEIPSGSEVALVLDGRVKQSFVVNFSPLSEELDAIGYSISLTDITERKQAEISLKESEEKYRQLYYSMNEGAARHQVIYDYSGKAIDYEITEVNNTFESITGLKRESVVGKRASVVYGTREPPYLDIYAGVAFSGEATSFETYFRPMDKYFSISVYSPAKGKFATIFSDISERKKAEEAFRESQTLLRAVLEGTPDPVYVKDKQSRILLSNPALEKVVGKSEAEITGKTDEEYYEDEEVGRQLREHDLHVMETGSGYTVEETVPTKNGPRTFLSNKVPYRNALGEIIGIIGISHDITERKKAEQALHESEVKAKALIKYAPTGIYEIDFRGPRFLSVNDAMCSLTGYTREELFAMGPTAMLDEDSRKVFAGRIKRQLAGETLTDIVEYKVKKKDGSVIFVTLNVAFSKERPGTALVIGHDLTERRITEEELRRNTVALEMANKELEAFSYSVSHDLRQPLRALEGFSRAVIEEYSDKLDEQGKDYLNRVRKASQHMSDLINDLLKLSRLSSMEALFEKLNLSEIVQSIGEELKNAHPERKAEFVISPEISVKGDKALLRIAIQNLLENSWKFTSKCPAARIEFGVTEQNGETVYFIRDNGTGFNMRYSDKLFQPFQRLHSETEYEGTGIGLAIVQRVIRRHGGRIWAESETGKGATFYFTLNQ